MTVGTLRLRKVASTWFPLFLAAIVLVGTASGWVAYTTAVGSEPTTREEVVSSWETAGSFEHSAIVREPNPLFAVETTLQNRSSYFLAVTPVLDGVFTFRYHASESGSLRVATTVVVETERVVERSGSGTVLWSERRVLADESSVSLGPTDRHRVPYSVNVSDVHNRSQQNVAAFGNPPGETIVTIEALVTLNGTVNGNEETRTQRHTMTIDPAESVYYVAPNGSRDTYQTTRAVPVEQSSGPLQTFVAPVLFVVSCVGVALVTRGRLSGKFELSETDEAYLAYRDARSDFDDWIVRMQLPSSVFDRPRVTADSLQDLVDFAIDTDNSVIEHPADETYYVLHDGYLYVYEPPQLPDESDAR